MVCRDAVRGKLNVLGPPGTHCRTRGEQPSADGLRRALLRPARLSHVLLPELPGSVPPGRVLRGQDPQGCRRPRPGRWGRITYKVRFAQTWTTNASPPWLSSPCNRKSTSLSQSGRRRPIVVEPGTTAGPLWSLDRASGRRAVRRGWPACRNLATACDVVPTTLVANRRPCGDPRRALYYRP